MCNAVKSIMARLYPNLGSKPRPPKRKGQRKQPTTLPTGGRSRTFAPSAVKMIHKSLPVAGHVPSSPSLTEGKPPRAVNLFAPPRAVRATPVAGQRQQRPEARHSPVMVGLVILVPGLLPESRGKPTPRTRGSVTPLLAFHKGKDRGDILSNGTRTVRIKRENNTVGAVH